MTRADHFKHEFVDSFPSELNEGVLYVSIMFASAAHKCACGCGLQVITPLSPTDWRMTFDGDTVSLDPSIGSWSFPCRSHYYITRDRVRWAGDFSADEVARVRALDRRAKSSYYTPPAAPPPAPVPAAPKPQGMAAKIAALLSRWF